MMNLEFFTLNIVRDYGIREFKKDLKQIFELVTVENKPSVLFIEDWQIVQPEFMEIINSLISSGEVSGLYTPEDIETMFSGSSINSGDEELRQSQMGQSLYDCFCFRLKQNLHVVLSLDHSLASFGQYLSTSPALITQTAIIYLAPYSAPSYASFLTKNLGGYQQLFAFFTKIHQNQCPLHFFFFTRVFEEIMVKNVQVR